MNNYSRLHFASIQGFETFFNSFSLGTRDNFVLGVVGIKNRGRTTIIRTGQKSQPYLRSAKPSYTKT